jgi:serine-type D-Ala-D-Ala carboxypeptidase/endopeptidase
MYRRLLSALALAAFVRSSSVQAGDSIVVDLLVEPAITNKAIVGCVIGIVDNGQREVHSYGEVHRGASDKPDGNTIYEIGSMTKAFTGTLLADMVIRNEVKLDAPLQDFLPAGTKLNVAKNQPIKLVDLASQTSGLPRLPDNIHPKDPTNPYADYSPELLFEFLGNHELRRAPGEYEYSNLGMGLLGTVLAKRAGKTYEQLVVERICDPLKMSDTRIVLTKEQQKRFAPPYSGALADEKNWDFDAIAGAGALRSTVNDLLTLAEASVKNKDKREVVRAIHEAWKPRYGKPGEIGVGLGWHIARDGVTRWHDGQTAGYTSAIFIYPPKRLGVVVLCNTATDVTSLLAEKVLQSMLGMKPEPIKIRKVAKVDPAVLKSYEGTYVLSLAFAITITVENGQLMAQATQQPKIQFFPESETKFFCKMVDAQISFEKDAKGHVNKLVLHQNGQDMPAARVPTKAADEKKKK